MSPDSEGGSLKNPLPSSPSGDTSEPAFVSPPNYGLLIFLAVGCIAFASAAAWYYSVERRQAQADVSQQIAAVAEIQVEQIANWRAERMGDATVLMADPIASAAERILDHRASTRDREDVTALCTRIAQTYHYAGVALADTSGLIQLLGPANTSDPAARALINQAISEQKAVLSDLALESGRPMMHVAVPVAHRGAVLLDIDPQYFLYPYLAAWPGKTATAESLLVRHEVDDIVYLSPRRNQLSGSASVFFRRALPDSRRLASADFELGWNTRSTDYRSVPVIGTVRRVPNSPWYLICKIDAAEAVAPIKHLELDMMLVAGIIFLGAGVALAFLWRNRRTTLLEQREAWFRGVTNDTPAYLWMASPEGKGFVNLTLARFLGSTEPPLSGYRATYAHPDDAKRVVPAFREALRTHSEFSAEYRLRRCDGEYRRIRDRGLPRFAPSGKFLGYVGAIEDVTPEHDAVEQLREANAALAGELSERTRAQQEVHRLSSRLIGAQEDERKRLARELHDDLNQQIAALAIAMGSLRRVIPDELTKAKEQSARILQNLLQLSEAVRRVSHQLHPAALIYSGLAAALSEYCAEFQALTHIHVDLKIEGNFEAVSAEQSLAVYRIAQESLQNIAKHAHTVHASMELTWADGILRLRISDEGVGLGAASLTSTNGIGLVTMRERARLVGGTVCVERGAQRGTEVTLEIPISPKASSPIRDNPVH
ncbi:MAG TPA: histidine kinase [Bryobacteraceae bacterium]|nr:histidine kinase [Bryobacteraceae bacterium]